MYYHIEQKFTALSKFTFLLAAYAPFYRQQNIYLRIDSNPSSTLLEIET
jgi:hypothetical protein